MDIKKSFQILELKVGASETEVRQAYRDIASVWHPDRFSGNPRLKRKAEEKLKEANAAYETLKSFFNGGETAESAGKKKEKGREAEKGGEVSRTELFVETGTEVVLTLWAHLTRKMGRILSDTGKRR
ncbi:MAG TPA: J domain-containing protein [Deltaproteobacteria bacterium]|nr:J domain-containing protein [Deltaproteobacteria bacterium]HIJ36624.1 J domain-containing protein [Deltaproteobacteria bacterium]HIJ36829.1 J domain-containing protein [Deltaproteobacteria bacterium]HIJ42294.1 J domain-containing protein [Deltaproteobacteria bacterium]